MPQQLSVRELQHSDIPLLINYWFGAPTDFLLSMGVDLTKMPTKEEFTQMLYDQLNAPIEQKKSYCIIWLLDNTPVGHSNTNPTSFGLEAKMHLHLWKADERKKGLGTSFLKITLPWFFNNLRLQKLICEPYALNPAPNKTLEKLGFYFEKEYITIPGFINFEQPVKRWEMTREKFEEINR